MEKRDRTADIPTWVTVKYRISLAIDFVAYFVRTFHNIIMAIAVRILFFSTGAYICFIVVAKLSAFEKIKMEALVTTEFEVKHLAQNMENFQHSLGYLFIPHCLMIVEAIYILLRKCGEEYHWICLSVFLYLCTSVPSILILQNFKSAKINASYIANETESIEIVSLIEPWKEFLLDFADSPQSADVTEYFTHNGGEVDANAYIQLLLVVLLFGRWMLPRGKITREQLSALLISYLSMCADMLDFISVLSVPTIKKNDLARHAIQTFWVISLFQFTMVKSNVGGPRQRKDWVEEMERNGFLIDVRSDDEEEQLMRNIMMNRFTETDLWGVLFTMLFQDLPFFIMRLIIIFYFKVTNETIYFFVVKNSVLVMMDVYRSLVICLAETEDTDQASLERLVPDLSRQVITVAAKRDTTSTMSSITNAEPSSPGVDNDESNKESTSSAELDDEPIAGPSFEDKGTIRAEVNSMSAPIAINDTDDVSIIL